MPYTRPHFIKSGLDFRGQTPPSVISFNGPHFIKCGLEGLPKKEKYDILQWSTFYKMWSGRKKEMNALCEMCKVLSNGFRLEIFMRIFQAKDGLNVGCLADDFHLKGLGVSGVSQYLKQLERLRIVRRVRAGRYVNYEANWHQAHPKVRAIIEMIVCESLKESRLNLLPIFKALMNPFRAQVVAAVAKAGSISAMEICEKTEHQMKYLKRDLQTAVEAGLLEVDDSDSAAANYCYAQPSNAVVQRLISLLL